MRAVSDGTLRSVPPAFFGLPAADPTEHFYACGFRHLPALRRLAVGIYGFAPFRENLLEKRYAKSLWHFTEQNHEGGCAKRSEIVPGHYERRFV